MSEPERRNIPIRFTISDDVKTMYANNVIVNHTPEGDFYLSFFEVLPPIVIGDAEQVRHAINSIDYVEAKCLTRIVINADRVKGLIAALVQNMTKFSSKEEQVKDETQEGEEVKHAS